MKDEILSFSPHSKLFAVFAHGRRFAMRGTRLDCRHTMSLFMPLTPLMPFMRFKPFKRLKRDALSLARLPFAGLFGAHSPSKNQFVGSDFDAPEVRRVLRAMLEPSLDAVCITLKDKVVFINTAFASIVGVAQLDAVIGRSIYSLLPAKFHAVLRQQAQHAELGDFPQPQARLQIAHGDGCVRDLTCIACAMPEMGDNVLQRVFRDVTLQTQERTSWERTRCELQRLSASQVDAREAERRHIAREMHDELGQRLTALKMELSNLMRPPRANDDRNEHGDINNVSGSGSGGDQRISALLGMVDDTIASVRRIASDLRPMMLDDLGLNPAIEWLARESAQRMNVKVSLTLEAPELPNEHRFATAIYRIVQEALTNVARHAHASHVHIETKRVGDELRVVVSDDGCGFSAQAMSRDDSHGLIGIRERTLSLGGHFEIGNRPTGGARIAIRLPLQLTGGRAKILTERRGQNTPSAQAQPCGASTPGKRSAVNFALEHAVKLLQAIPARTES